MLKNKIHLGITADCQNPLVNHIQLMINLPKSLILIWTQKQ